MEELAGAYIITPPPSYYRSGSCCGGHRTAFQPSEKRNRFPPLPSSVSISDNLDTHSLLHQIKRVEGGFWLGEWRERKSKKEKEKRGKKEKLENTKPTIPEQTKTRKPKRIPQPHPPILRVKSGKRSPGPGASERRRLFAALRLQIGLKFSAI